jgi:hypothetical protein
MANLKKTLARLPKVLKEYAVNYRKEKFPDRAAILDKAGFLLKGALKQ